MATWGVFTRIVLNFGMAKRRLSLPTRRDQYRAGPEEVKRTATQHSTNRGTPRTANAQAITRSIARFHTGRRDEESVVAIMEKCAPIRWESGFHRKRAVDEE